MWRSGYVEIAAAFGGEPVSTAGPVHFGQRLFGGRADGVCDQRCGHAPTRPAARSPRALRQRNLLHRRIRQNVRLDQVRPARSYGKARIQNNIRKMYICKLPLQPIPDH